MNRAAGILFGLNGAGFGIFVFPGIIRLLQHREIPLVFGFPAYGGGPFERVGIKTTIPLLLAFLLINVLQVVAGVLIWSSQRGGAILGLATLPFAALFWWGFALPFGPLLAAVGTILIVFDWSRLL